MGHQGYRKDHSLSFRSIGAPNLLHSDPITRCTPLKTIPPLSFSWDPVDTELLGVLLHDSCQPEIICFARNGFQIPPTRESGSSSALSVWECHAFVIFLAPQVGWCMWRDCRRWSGAIIAFICVLNPLC